MKLRITQQHLNNFIKAGLIICVIAIIIQLFPSENKFKYQFEIGKPWPYELITASFDFPIYKNEEIILKETSELLKNYAPYFVLDTTASKTQFTKLMKDYESESGEKLQHQPFLQKKLSQIYARGVIGASDLSLLEHESRAKIHYILPNRITKQIAINELYTPKTAYEEILRDAPEKIKEYNLNVYLVENLKFDSATSAVAKNDLLKTLSLTSGMVQTGERIIDRGEIVTADTYAALNSLKIEYQKRKSSIQQSSLVIIGEIIIISVLVLLFFLYLYLFRPRIFDSFGNLLFISLLILIVTALASITVRFTTWNYFMIPFALLPIIIRVFFDSRTALFAHIITMLIISFMVDNSFRFVVLQIAIGMAAVSSLKDMTQRSQLAQTALYIFMSYVGLYIAFEFIAEGELQRINWIPVLYFAVSSAFLLLAYILIYIFEKIFGLISAVTLVELTNVNSDLMMKFAETAPGTFQHTLQVSNLATEAAKKIGANSLLVRTGALYHDIGKMKNPHYFIENQLGGPNPLAEMDFEAASRIIIDHVNAGVEIARKNHLPEQIINFITTHHGLGKTKYFYNSFINANPGVTPNVAAYCYPGPLPNSKETAILMMADAVEARSRSLGVYTEENINDAVEKMIDSQIADGQFKDAPISFRDVETVKAIFKEKIKNIYHSRIVYPELKEK
ncbi:MAG: HDIG domain-containing protein [Paludibacteraceae bacterium]|nr:HDIG domain-containing protein [Paludibacteraceae bacterium]